MTPNAVEAEAATSSKVAWAPGEVISQWQEPIQGLLKLASLARHALGTPDASQNGTTPFAEAFRGECIGCGMRISGEELLLLSAEEANVSADSKIDRLRKGYCARRTCESRFYRISCLAQPGVNWETILTMKDVYLTASEKPDPEPLTSGGKKWMLAAAAVVALLLLVTIAFQYYAGGAIPFLREPEKFQVDPLPVGAEPPI